MVHFIASGLKIQFLQQEGKEGHTNLARALIPAQVMAMLQ